LQIIHDDANLVGMPPDDKTPRVPQGPIGAYLIKNLEQLRKARRLSYQDLSVRLREVGRPIPALGLSRIEKGTRRVDADDLVGLALALGVNPSALLLPRDAALRDVVTLTEEQQASANDAWAWADGRRPLPPTGPFTRSSMDLQAAVDFATHARPEWAPLPDTLQALGYTREQPTEAAESHDDHGT
jgi:transcriptional regulator with XRE-family HTH domain